MDKNIKAVAESWNKTHATTIKELEALELSLKTNYNKYIDSLVDYLDKLQTVNEIRSRIVRELENEDVSNETRTAIIFNTLAEGPINNNALEYIIDRREPAIETSRRMVLACSTVKLLQRKIKITKG